MPALDGIKVLDLTRNMPGNYCGMLLGDMGADILKVEEAFIPASSRRSSSVVPAFEREEKTRAFYALGRNKRSIGLNLKDERGRELFYRLVREVDVVLEGFRPGVAKRLGVDYETLCELNPRLVYASITGYGQYGPYSQLPGHDINYISQAGALSLIGTAPDEPPVVPLNLLADLAGGGEQAALGITAALLARERTGRGQFVDISMSDGATQLISAILCRYFETREVPQRGRESLAGSQVHYHVYQCKDGRWISIGSIEPYFYEAFCRALGREDWLPNQQAPLDVHARMIEGAREIFKTRTADEWFEHLNKSDLCAMRILSLDDLPENPHTRARGMVLDLDHPTVGPVQQVGFGIKFSATPSEVRSFAPAKGQHTEEVLGALGLSESQIAELRAGQVVA